ncbi:artemis protein [Nemania sp. NC0429]|nr:artemis protein [Nemania sp. NC0429]
MSTFKGIVSEFPDIRVDYFRRLPGFPPPLACFLSHVHSDHLAGLEAYDGPFIYCSAATRAILLRLEKTSVRLNYAQGVLEDPGLQTYKHLDKKLKPLPLDTPTTIYLHPGSSLQVTLLDANHCVGAVMFLLEGYGKAVLYTGDIRCEPRFVTAITQNPNMVEYSSGWKTLDRIYLDTSVLDNYPLPTKANGLRELIEQVRKYPEDTIFHFQAWTYGYEEVWIALSKALNSRVHVDEYKMRVFKSLVTKPKDNRWAAQTHLAKEAPALVGFTCGNSPHGGCLTLDENVRLHSCEKGMGCDVMEQNPVVSIRPIVAHLEDGRDVMEVGLGGGGDDLTQTTTLTSDTISRALELVGDTLPAELQPYIHMAKNALSSGRDISLKTDAEGTSDEAIPRLIKSLLRKLEDMHDPIKQRDENATATRLPDVIYFPYARHSSLPELRAFVNAFKARDITPCTFDVDIWLQKGWSIRELFSDCCSGQTFDYDMILDDRAKDLAIQKGGTEEQGSGSQQIPESPLHDSSPYAPLTETTEVSETVNSTVRTCTGLSFKRLERWRALSAPAASEQRRKRDYDIFANDSDLNEAATLLRDSQASDIPDQSYEARRRAFDIANSNINGGEWGTIALISTTDNHTALDEELGAPNEALSGRQ